MAEPSDFELLTRFQRGDTSAFAQLVERHQAALLRHAQALLGSGSPFEDVVQDAFLKLAQNPPRLEAEATDAQLDGVQLSSWLHRVARNLCMDVMRSESRRRSREQEVALREAHDGGVGTIDAQDTRAVVEAKLGTLPQDQREVLVLRLLGEKSYREIADITGKKIGTIGWLVSVGLKSLSKELAPLFGAAQGTGRAVGEADLGFGKLQGELS